MERKRTDEIEYQTPKRVIFENQDGTVRYYEGENAEKWNRVMGGLVTLGFAHGGQGQKELKSLEWKEAANLNEVSSPELKSTFLLIRGDSRDLDIAVIHAENQEKAWEIITKNLKLDQHSDGNVELIEVKNARELTVLRLL